MPYKGNLRDRLLTRFGPNRFVLLRRSLTYLEHLFQNFTLKHLPYYNIYQQAERLLRNDPSIRILVASAMPFSLFGMCYRLHKKFGIPWIADYRDDWNTTSWKTNYNENSILSGRLSLPVYILKLLESKTEKRWLRSAALFTTVSKYYAWKISNFILKPGKVIYNGYEAEQFHPILAPFNGELKITYAGNLYFTQDVSILALALQKVGREHPDIKLSVRFIGTGYDPKQVQRLHQLFKEVPAHLLLTDWLSPSEVEQYLAESHVFLAVANKGIKGALSSKIFVYMSYKKPILLCPPDNDEQEQILIDSGLGLRAANAEEAARQLSKLIFELKQNPAIQLPYNEEVICAYSRRQQAFRFAQVLHSVLQS